MSARGMAAAQTVARRLVRSRIGVQHYAKALREVDDRGYGFGSQSVSNMARDDAMAAKEEIKGLWNGSTGKWMAAAGAFTLSFAASMTTVAFAKERVADRFSPREVVLYQYDACPFCNKVKGELLVFLFPEVLCFFEVCRLRYGGAIKVSGPNLLILNGHL